MYDKSQLVEQIAKPAEPVNGNLKNPNPQRGRSKEQYSKIWRKNKWD